MQGLQPIDPTSNYLIVYVIYYIALLIVAFWSFSSVFVLIKNGRSRPLSLFISGIYILFFLSLAGQGISLLADLK